MTGKQHSRNRTRVGITLHRIFVLCLLYNFDFFMESFGNFYVNTSRFMFLSVTGQFSSSGPIAKGWLKAFEVMPEVVRRGLLVRLRYFTRAEFSDGSSVVWSPPPSQLE